MLRRNRHVRVWSKNSTKRTTRTKIVCKTRTGTRGKGLLPGLVQPVCSFFTVGGDTGGAHSGVTDLCHSCTSGKSSSPGILEAGTQFQLQQLQTPPAGVRVEETSSFGGRTERFA